MLCIQSVGLFGSSPCGVNEVQTGHTIQRLLLHYPAAGYRHSSSGGFASVSSSGYNRSATTLSAASACSLYFSSGSVNPRDNNSRAFGITVRCVSVF